MMRALTLVAAGLLALTLALPARAAVVIQPVTSEGGLTAWLVEERSIPMVAIEVIFPGGGVLDPDGALGATALMASLLTQGAGELDALAYAKALEDTAGDISFEAGRDQVSLTIRALSENLDEVVALAHLALTAPRFDPVDVARTQAQQASALERAARNPNSIASQRFNALSFDAHPYARPASGTPESVRALTRPDLLAAHRAAFSRGRVLVGAAGDIDAARLGALMDRLLGDLPAEAPPLPAFATFVAAPGISVVDHPAPQSVIAFGHEGLRRDDPDFTAAFVLNDFFGGGRFGTRLMTELRERRGLTYGVGTSMAAGAHGATFQGRISTDNARAAEVIGLIRAEWAWLAGGGMTQADLDRTITYLTGAYPLRFDGNGAIAEIMASMQFQGFDIDYVNIRNDLIRSVTLADIERVAQRIARPEELVFVVVGRPEGLSGD
jgi:zinc protease